MAAGAKRLLVVAPTGSGKTLLAASLIARAVDRQAHVLFLAHRRELVQQTWHKLRDAGLQAEQVGVLMANDPRRRPGAPVQVASVDTLRHRAKPLADLVFVDECHRALARSYRDLAAHYSRAVHIGLTATPYRADGRGLGAVYDELIQVASPRQLIAEGHLVEPRVFTLPAAAMPDLSGVRVRGGDYDEVALARALDQQKLVGNIVEHWHEHARGLKTVAFAVSVAHSKHIVDRFRAAGVPAEHLDGSMPAVVRDATLARLERGETLVVSNCALFSEGWDQPSVKCAILARPTKSTGLYLQQAGRILRPYQGQPAVILDHAGCALEHGLPQDDREFSLEVARRPKRPGGVPPARVCPECFAVVALAARRCPSCGAILAEHEDVPAEREGRLVEASPTDLRAMEWTRLQALAAAKGYQAGWAYHRFREKFGDTPPGPGVLTGRPEAPVARIEGVLRERARARGGTVSWADLTAGLADV